MSAAWEERFSSWAQSPSQSEAEKIEHAINAVDKALAAWPKVATVTKAFVQGSYRNRVNVRQNSDVDIAVVYTPNIFFPKYPPGLSRQDFNHTDASYTYAEFKNDIGDALNEYFGRGNVTRGDKAFDIRANTYRVDADVVPVLEHRWYRADRSYISGTQFHPDSGGVVVNWPEQHYSNGNTKNNNTRRAYRGTVRIIKKLWYLMCDNNVAEAKPLKGFNIECLVWNVPDYCFSHTTWFDVVTTVLNYLSIHLCSMQSCGQWTEVSELKNLLEEDEAKRQRFKAFIDRARLEVGLS